MPERPDRFILPAISEQVEAIHKKLEEDRTGNTLTETELSLEVTNDEAAYLLSAIAGREVGRRYLGQLTREYKGNRRRLYPYRAVGNTYTYQVEALLKIRFIKRPEKKGPQLGSDEGTRAA